MKNNFIKKVAVTSLVALASISVFTGCTMNENQGNKIAIEQDATGGNGQKINEKEVKPTTKVSPEYTKKTVNENGVTIYGKIVDINTASPTGKKVIQDNALGDKKENAKGYTYTYSEYYSEAYGGTVIIKTTNQNGGRGLYNENGHCILTYSSKSKDADLEKSLANYMIGKAMSKTITDKIKNK